MVRVVSTTTMSEVGQLAAEGRDFADSWPREKSDRVRCSNWLTAANSIACAASSETVQPDPMMASPRPPEPPAQGALPRIPYLGLARVGLWIQRCFPA
jgi:hypothetical protein